MKKAFRSGVEVGLLYLPTPEDTLACAFAEATDMDGDAMARVQALRLIGELQGTIGKGAQLHLHAHLSPAQQATDEFLAKLAKQAGP